LHVSGVGMLTLHAETPVIGVTKVRYIQYYGISVSF
jgi:hypothetical protein